MSASACATGRSIAATAVRACLRPAVEGAQRRAGLDDDHAHVVGHDVVQLAGDPFPLLGDGLRARSSRSRSSRRARPPSTLPNRPRVRARSPSAQASTTLSSVWMSPCRALGQPAQDRDHGRRTCRPRGRRPAPTSRRSRRSATVYSATSDPKPSLTEAPCGASRTWPSVAAERDREDGHREPPAGDERQALEQHQRDGQRLARAGGRRAAAQCDQRQRREPEGDRRIDQPRVRAEPRTR